MQTVPVQFLFFHPAILEPDFDLPVSEVEHPRELESFLFVYVYIKEKLAFQFADLVLGVGTALFPGPLGGHGWELVASCSRGVIATLSRAQGALIYIFLCGVRSGW